ncbi:PH domain-containing protein [Aquipuribacter hungaricus]|uniref:PH domain-containing protein n=1 Tax=Aquipuribacter hungaricus TaxID=545624 RepID=A0ABV7WEG7_9MICO
MAPLESPSWVEPYPSRGRVLLAALMVAVALALTLMAWAWGASAPLRYVAPVTVAFAAGGLLEAVRPRARVDADEAGVTVRARYRRPASTAWGQVSGFRASPERSDADVVMLRTDGEPVPLPLGFPLALGVSWQESSAA